MKVKPLHIVLAASLAFNVFFLVGTFMAQAEVDRAGADEEWIDLLTRELDLDTQQEEKLRAWHEDYALERDQRREEFRSQIERFFDEIVKEEPNQAVIDEFIATAPGREWRAEMVQRSREFMEILRPEQRVQAVELIRNRYSRRMDGKSRD